MAKLLSTAEAAEVIGVERSTLTRWVQLGRMTEAHKVEGANGIRLFDEDEVERVRKEYAAERAEKAEATS